MKLKYLRPLAIQEELLKQKMLIFTPREFSNLFKISSQKTKYFLETQTKNGWLIRLKKGLYSLKGHWPDEREIAGALYKPSYISFEYALAEYGIIPEMVYSVTCATTKPTRIFMVAKKTFTYTTIQKKIFTGYRPIIHQNRTILMAEPEKALADTLYLVSLGKKSLNERLNLKKLNRQKIKRYAALYQRPGLTKLIRQLFS